MTAAQYDLLRQLARSPNDDGGDDLRHLPRPHLRPGAGLRLGRGGRPEAGGAAAGWEGRRRAPTGYADTLDTSLNRVVNRGERISNFVDQVRFSTSPALAGTTVPHPNRLLQASMAAVSAPDFSRSRVRIVGGGPRRAVPDPS